MSIVDLSRTTSALAVVSRWVLLGLLLFIPLSASATFLIDQRTSGAWYDPAHDGEGFALEVLADGRAVVYWFTFDENGDQRWFIGQGTVQGSTIEFDLLLAPRGALFGPAFDPSQIEFEPVGDARFQFFSCSRGEVVFRIDGVSLRYPLNRLTLLDGMACPVDKPGSKAGLSGSFFPPAHNGEGFVVQVLDDDRALIYWFTYDDAGNPMWLVGVASRDNENWQVNQLLRPTGGRFGAQFDPDEVVAQPWGSLLLSLACTGGSAQFDALDERFGEGELDLSRLSRVSRLDCDDLIAGHAAAPAATPTCGQARDALQGEVLRQGTQLIPVDYSQFMPASDCAAARHELNLKMNIPGGPIFATNIDPTLFGFAQMAQFPRVEFDLIADGSALIPVQQDVIRGGADGSYWNLVLSEGLVWSEPDDGNWSRASFPFVLVNDYYNESHNGVATFLFNHNRVSGLRFQVGQELSTWNKGDYWGQVAVDGQMNTVDAQLAQNLRQIYRRERQSDLPVRPIADLYAEAGQAAMSEFKRNTPEQDITATGVVLDGVLYLDQTPTRFGSYPYPQQMRLGAFSVTKSASAALALLHLAQRYGPEILNYRIADYVDVTAQHDGWDNVTFAHAIGMATGIGHANPDPNNSLFADENDPNNPDFGFWSIAGTAQSKLNIGFRYGKLPWGPGEVVRYNTMHTFVVTAAMDALVKQREGEQVNLWDLIQAEVLAPMGVHVLPTMHTIEADGSRGIPLGGVGLYLNPQDIAKIGLLFDREGDWLGETLLHPGLTRQALYRGDDYGLRAARWYQVQTSVWTQAYYNLSFWGVDFAPGAPCAPIIPEMEGFGGNLVVVPPNGVIAFRFADADVYDPGALAVTSDRLRPFCQ